MKQEGRDASVELWDYVAGERKQILPEAGGRVVFSARGNLLATRGWGRTAKIWDLATGQLVHSLKETDGVTDLAFSPDGQTLATSRRDEVQLWNVITGEQIGSLTNDGHRVGSLAFSPEGRFLATGGADQTVTLWDVPTRQQTAQLRGHRGEVISVAFSPDGQMLASGSKDKTAMLWSIHPKRAVTTVTNVVSRPIFSPDGRLVAAGINQGTSALSADGGFVPADINQGRVAVWDVATLEVKAIFDGASDAVAFSSDGSALVTRGPNYFLKTFDLATLAERTTISGRPAEGMFSLSPDGQILASGSLDGTLTLFDAKTGAVLATISHAHAGIIFVLAFSPNGRLLATVGRGAMAANVTEPKIWDVATHKLTAKPAGHTEIILSVAFSPDGKTLATCSMDNSIRFWNTTTWKEIPPFLEHREGVNSLAFSPNGKTLASDSWDNTMKLWNVATRRELAALRFDSAAEYMTFSPDGQTLAVRFWDRSLRLLRAPVPDKKPSRPRDD